MGNPDRTWKVLSLLIPTLGTVVCAGLTAWANIQVAELQLVANRAQATATSAAAVVQTVAESQPGHPAAPAVQVKLRQLEQIQAEPLKNFRTVRVTPAH